MPLSSLLVILGGLLAATTVKWSQILDWRTLNQIYQDAKAGRLHSTWYQKIATPVAAALILVGLYLALTQR
jgi:hypothetical protein